MVILEYRLEKISIDLLTIIVVSSWFA